MSTHIIKQPKHIYVRYENHFDLVWRRCWKKEYTYQGLTYRPYADVEEAVLTKCLELSENDGAAFQVEQAITMREYLRRHPDKIGSFKKLHQEKRFALLGAGEAIIDTNMCSGETLVRNYVSGTRYAIQLFGQAAKFANHNDGFGSSAQLPQIIRGCGMKGIDNLSYSKPDGPYWRGLDGSTVFVGFKWPGKVHFYDHCYYEPCLACKGSGKIKKNQCKACEGTGLRISQGVYPRRDWVEALEEPLGQYVVYSEEMLPDQDLPSLLKNKNLDDGIRFRWGSAENLDPLWTEALSKVDEAGVKLSSRIENNPTQTGTLVSRIRVKQVARRAENAYFMAEKIVALTGAGTLASFGDRLEQEWLSLPLLFFHDSITGTHNDPASEELLEVAEKTILATEAIALEAVKSGIPGATKVNENFSGGQIVVFNPHGFCANIPVEMATKEMGFSVSDKDGAEMPVFRQPAEKEPMVREFSPVGAGHYITRNVTEPSVLGFVAEKIQPFSFKLFNVVKQRNPVPCDSVLSQTGLYEMGEFKINWDKHGVTSLYSLAKQQELLEVKKGRAGYLIIEDDVGDPWGTRDSDRKRIDCQAMQSFHSAKATESKVELIYSGRFENGSFANEKEPSVFGLEWIQKVIISRNLPWIEFQYDVFWQAVNKRIRIAFPSRAQSDKGLYSIPYGALWRERYEMTEHKLYSPNGDWPALHYVASCPSAEISGLAVINTGTPSARIENGVVMHSVLRSPGFGHCLFRYAQEYPMPTSEIRDGGFHKFRFGLMPFDGSIPELHRAGSIMNSKTPVFKVRGKTLPENKPFSVNQPGVFIESVKTAYEGGIALRVVEMEGKQQAVELTVPDDIEKADITNMLEENGQDALIVNGTIRFQMKPFQISTIVLKIRGG